MSATTDAKRAITSMGKHEAALEADRVRRDRAIHEMHADERKNPPTIARELGLSVSLVRLVLRMPKPKS